MLTKSELTRTCVAMTVEDATGRHLVTTRRGRGGQVSMSCTCEAHGAEGWCLHQVDLLSLRYGAVVEQDNDAEFHFEDIILGTALAEAADEVDVALASHRDALAALARHQTADMSSDALLLLADRAADVSDASRILATSLGRLRRKLVAARSPSMAD
jgi:hypothetical protein